MSGIKRGDIWLASLDPTIGHEVSKTRPAIIIQNDIGNNYSPTTIIAPMTSQKVDKIYPVEVIIRKQDSGLDKDGKVLLNHIRTVDKQRLVKKIGNVNELALEKIDDAIRISLGLTNF